MYKIASIPSFVPGRFLLPLLICLFLGVPAHAQSGRKVAFLIGIGDYPAEGGWRPINAMSDIPVISDALLNRGFSQNDMILVKNAEATRAGILNTWNNVFLPRIRSGDVVYFQFSGHGQQVADDNGDELDGYDEAIVPYDSPMRYQPGVYQGENLIRDDELNRLFNDLRRRLGPTGNLMVVLDACHSGTGTRGMAPVRGTDVLMASDNYVASSVKRQQDGYSAPQFEGAGAGELAPMAAFFGSAQNQLNEETRDERGQLLGSLTYALSKKLSQASPSTSYRGLFDQIKLEMSTLVPRQQPQVEGNLDQELLGGRLLERPKYFRVVRWNDPGSVVVDAGWLQGLNEGSVLGIFPPDTRDPSRATPLAKGTVARALPLEATLQLEGDLQEALAKGAWAFVLEQNFGELRIALSNRLPQNHPLYAPLMNKISKYPMIRLDEAPELFLAPNGNGSQLIGTGDMVLEETNAFEAPDVAAERLLRRLLAFGQAKYMRKLEAKGNYLNVDFEIVLVQLDERTLAEKSQIPLESRRDALGNIHLRDGDTFKIKVHNRGNKKAYFTLLDIQPDNVMNPLIPGDNETPDEFWIQAGQSLEVPKLFSIGPPSGVETFKMIATENPVDLRPISISRGEATRAVQDPLEKLFGNVLNEEQVQTRGGKTANLAAGSIHVHTYTFIID